MSLTPYQKQFWDEKVEFMKSGDITPEGKMVFRWQGFHYVIVDPEEFIPGPDEGINSYPVVVEFIAGPHKGKKFRVGFGVNVMSNGQIPDEYKDILKENAIVYSYSRNKTSK